MKTLPISQIQCIPPETADSELRELFDEIQRITDAPVVNNVWQILGNSMCVLTGRRKIIQFAIRCADEPLTVKEEDYAQIRNFGITDAEIVEIVSLAAMGSYFDILADALKLEVDSYLRELLPGEQLVR